MIGRAIINKRPLPPNRFAPLPPGAITPGGWLKQQLDLELDALHHTLDARLPALEDSCWLGGSSGDACPTIEAVAALAPVAYVTGDESLKALVKRFVDAAVHGQRPDGDIGPASLHDWWPKMLMLRVLRIYFGATADVSALKCIDRFLKFELQALPDRPLMDYAAARAGENLEAAVYLYNLTEQPYLIKLCELIRAQSLDWTSELNIFPHIRATARQMPWKPLKAALAREGAFNGIDQKVSGREFHLTEAVNVAIGLKTPGLINLFKSGFKEVTAFKAGFQKLMRLHGVALSMYTADWHLAGGNPAQGVSLVAVTELIRSLLTLIGTGDEFGSDLADILEKLAYNALPAAWSPDMTAHQPLQQVNQIDLTAAPRSFYNAPDDALLPRVRPIDLGEQGFAAFTAGLWYATADDGLAAISYAPATVSFVAGGERVRVTVEGDYPFSGNVTIRVAVRAPAEFPIYLRIPGWVGQAMIALPDGELMQMAGGEIACVRRRWVGEATMTLDLPMMPRVTRWAHRSAAVELGPLLMALPVDDRVDWRQALDIHAPMKVVDGGAVCAFKHGAPALTVLAKAAHAPDWDHDGVDAAQPPIEPILTPGERVITLIPYGDTDRRIAQFPVAELLTERKV